MKALIAVVLSLFAVTSFATAPPAPKKEEPAKAEVKKDDKKAESKVKKPCKEGQTEEKDNCHEVKKAKK